MEIPSTFDISYHYLAGKENSFLNKISTCVLKSVNVQYGGDRFKTYKRDTDARIGKGAPPQQSKISLVFQEMEIITKDRIEQGY